MLSIGEIEQRGKVVTLKDCEDSIERECFAVLSKNKKPDGKATDWCYFVVVEEDSHFRLAGGKEFEVDGRLTSAEEASAIGDKWVLCLVGKGAAPES